MATFRETTKDGALVVAFADGEFRIGIPSEKIAIGGNRSDLIELIAILQRAEEATR